jgi:hypothetical protein
MGGSMDSEGAANWKREEDNKEEPMKKNAQSRQK